MVIRIKTSGWIGLAGLTLVLAAAVYLGMRTSRPGSNPAGETPAAPPLTIPVTRGEVAQTVLAPGQLRSRSEGMLAVAAGGKLQALLVQPGSRVQSGDLVARLEGDPAGVPAPFDGVIVETLALPGEYLQPGQNLALLVDPDDLEARVTIIEEDLPLVQEGMPAELYFDASPDLAVAGRVERIVPYRIEREDRPLYAVYLSIESIPAGLAPGMTVDASIVIAWVGDALRLPRGVIRVDEDGRARVRVWMDGRIEERTVTTGLRGNAYIEILDGLLEGDQVVGE